MNRLRLLKKAIAARWATPAIIAMLLVTLGINEWMHARTQRFRAERVALFEARSQGMEALHLLTDAEASQRGFLLTGREDYLGPYLTAVQALDASLNRSLTFIEAAGGDAARVRQLFALKLSELAITTEMQRAGRREQALELVMSDIGKEGMDTLRQAMRAGLEDALVRERASEALLQRELGVRRWTIHVLALLAALGGLAYGRRLVSEARASASARLRLECEVQARTADLRELASNLQTVQEDERGRLSRELHDEMGSLLTAAKFDLLRIRNAQGPEQLAERLKQATRLLDEVVAIKRRIIEDLRPSALQHLGLSQALLLLCAEVSNRLDMPVQTRVDEVRLPEAAQITIYRLVQEALTNVQKYAQAQRVTVTLTADDRQVVLRIEDDGAGFDVKAVHVARHGLAGMRHRVEALGGQFLLDSAPGRGTRITATLPEAAITRPATL